MEAAFQAKRLKEMSGVELPDCSARALPQSFGENLWSASIYVNPEHGR
jgi:hypothetical protein